MSAKKGLMGWLSAFVAFDMVILGSLLAPHFQVSDIDSGTITRAIASMLAPPALLLLTSILSPDMKACLVFWRVRYALPGHRAFSKYIEGDSRIDAGALEKKIGAFPNDPAAQNSEWYRIYRAHRTEDAVLDANRRYLLFRDLATLSAFLVVVVPLTLKFVGLSTAFGPAAAVFAVQYVLSAIAAQQAGIRFVRTVLAIESSCP